MNKEKEIEGIIGDTLSFATALLMSSVKKNKELTEEEKIKRQEKLLEIEKKQNEELRVVTIAQGRCPECYGKLTRGKKDKKNNYKRSWKCSECEVTHYA